MKKQFLFILSLAAICITSCQTGTFAYYDDIYSSSNDDQYKIMRAESQHNTANNPKTITYYEEIPAPDSISYQYNEDGSIGTTYY